MKIGTAMLTLILISLSPSFASSRAEVRNMFEKRQSGKAHTPPKGSAERKAILDALRAEMKRLHQADFIFTVNYIKVQQGWGWIEVAPKSADGNSNFENVSALMRKHGKRWDVAQIACAEEGNPECLGDPNFFKNLRTKFPNAPKAIFPK